MFRETDDSAKLIVLVTAFYRETELNLDGGISNAERRQKRKVW